MDTVRVSSRGQLVIPRDARKRLGISAGTKLVLLEKEDTLIFEKEQTFTKKLEKLGWLKTAEKSLAKVWDNPDDDSAWSRYL